MTTLQQFQEPGTLSYFNITTPGTQLKGQRNAILSTEIPSISRWYDWPTSCLFNPANFWPLYRQAQKLAPKTASLTYSLGAVVQNGSYIYMCSSVFLPHFLSMVDTEPCSSASRLPGIDFPKVTPEIICETGPDFINDLAKKTKHVRISFQWPGGPARIEYEWWLDRTKLEDQEETLLHRCQKWSKFNLCSFRKMKRNGGNIWTK